MGSGKADVARPAQVHGAGAQRQRALNAGTAAVNVRERPLHLARPGGVQRSVFLAPPQREQPARGAGAARLERTRYAVRGGEAMGITVRR